MTKYLIPCVLCAAFTFTGAAFGQKQDYVWYFGPSGVGLDFNSCEPTVVTDGHPDLMAFEGMTSMCDATSGDLLFYTSGYRVYDRLKQPMPNGAPVGLSNSLAQMAIAPWPGSPNKYFLIIPEMQAGISWQPLHPAAFSLYYAVIDMSLNGGLGDVSSAFNVLLTAQHCEFLTVVPHTNGEDFWLVVHGFNSNTFYVFPITSTGIATEPLVHHIGPVVETPQPGTPSSSNMDALGAMRATPRGDRIAFTTAHNGITCVLDLDATTGEVSNPMQLSIPGGGYGITFSPDGSKLYVGVRSPLMSNTFQNGALVQFDLASGGQNEVQASLATLHQVIGFGGFTTLKLGPDRRIYVARVSSNGTSAGDGHLGVVNDPDLPALDCDYVHDGIWLNGGVGSWSLSNAIEYGHDCRSTPIASIERSMLVIRRSEAGYVVDLPDGPDYSRCAVSCSDGRMLFDLAIPKGATSIAFELPVTATGVYIVSLSGPEHRSSRSIVHVP